MSLAELSPQSRALRTAVKDYCGKTGVNAATLGTVTEKFVGLLAARWEHICDVALAEENEGRVNVGLRITFDMTHKTPVGSLTLSFSQRTRDESTFQVEDPDQGTLPFAEVVRQTASQPEATTTRTSATPSPEPSPEPSRQPGTTARQRRASRRSAGSSAASSTPPESQPSSSTATSATAGSTATPTAQTAASGTDEQEVIAPPRPPRRRRRPAAQAQQPQPAATAQDTPF